MGNRLIEKWRRKTRLKRSPRPRVGGTHLHDTNPVPRFPRWVVKTVLVTIGVMFIWMGLFPMLGGFSNYRNWWGGLVFAPMAILGGGALIYGMLFKYDEMRKPRGASSRYRR